MKLLFDENVSPVRRVSRSFPKITDFRERSFVEGFPPKVMWLDVGNSGTSAIVALLRRERARLEQFGELAETSVLILSIGASAV